MRLGRAAALVCFTLIAPAPLAAQTPPASQRGTVSQTINTTTVTLEYHRPVARGRVLFGADNALVLYGAYWTPGANRATILELSEPSQIEGKRVEAGKYGVWMRLGASEWTLILSRVWDSHHSIYPGEEEDVLRATLKPETSSHMETLAFYFPTVGPYEATLQLHWGTTVLPIRIEVGR